MANPLYNQKQIADFERVCLSWEYSHETAIVQNNSGATVNLKGLPYPVKLVAAATAGTPAQVEVMTAVESQTPANIYGFLVTNRHEEIANSGASMEHYAVLVRGETVVYEEGWKSFDGTVMTDLAGADYALADFATFCAAANPPIIISTQKAALKSQPIY